MQKEAIQLLTMGLWSILVTLTKGLLLEKKTYIELKLAVGRYFVG